MGSYGRGIEIGREGAYLSARGQTMKRLGDWFLLGYFALCVGWAIVQAWVDNRQIEREKQTETERPSEPQRPAA
jgi:hypothetical protein